MSYLSLECLFGNIFQMSCDVTGKARLAMSKYHPGNKDMMYRYAVCRSANKVLYLLVYLKY